jgi:NAD(P)-dependent dehydrogenase (short-subunit alcohol dehydrogenase family)
MSRAHNKVVVVTGAGRGIGRAIAERMAREGARIVVNDLDVEAAQEVATAIGGVAVAGDAASEEGVAALIDATEQRLGAIDMFFGNAGVVALGDAGADESLWAQSLEVNLMAHVRAARILVPRWLEGGGGRLVITASAAGLLTMPGAAPYAASKHAVVGFAEWLSMTYGDRGIVVQCICPQGVDTRMLAQLGDSGRAAVQNGAVTPEQVAEATWQGLQDDRMLILPHAEVRKYYRQRAEDTDRWLRGMRTLLPAGHA